MYRMSIVFVRFHRMISEAFEFYSFNELRWVAWNCKDESTGNGMQVEWNFSVILLSHGISDKNGNAFAVRMKINSIVFRESKR